MGVYLRAKFEVSSIILTSFRRGEGNFPASKEGWESEGRGFI